MSRGLNEASLIGNLTKDPELRYTPQGTPVCSFSIATNRGWTSSSGEKKQEATFHRIVAWDKLGEICGQYLVKGKQVFVKGRIANRSYKDQQGVTKYISEIVASEMIMLGGPRTDQPQVDQEPPPPTEAEEEVEVPPEPEPIPEPRKKVVTKEVKKGGDKE